MHFPFRLNPLIPCFLNKKKVDIWCLPTGERIHAAIGQEIQKSIFSANPGGRNTSGLSSLYTYGHTHTSFSFLFLFFIFILGIIMSLHLYRQSQNRASTSAAQDKSLSLLCAYENGSVVLREYDQKDKE